MKDHEKEPNKDNDGTIKESQIHDPKSRKLDNGKSYRRILIHSCLWKHLINISTSGWPQI